MGHGTRLTETYAVSLRADNGESIRSRAQSNPQSNPSNSKPTDTLLNEFNQRRMLAIRTAYEQIPAHVVRALALIVRLQSESGFLATRLARLERTLNRADKLCTSSAAAAALTMAGAKPARADRQR